MLLSTKYSTTTKSAKVKYTVYSNRDIITYSNKLLKTVQDKNIGIKSIRLYN